MTRPSIPGMESSTCSTEPKPLAECLLSTLAELLEREHAPKEGANH